MKTKFPPERPARPAPPCARCKEPIAGPTTRLVVLSGPPLPGATYDVRLGQHVVDLCGECLEALGRFLSDRGGTGGVHWSGSG
jgi:hypothetical protein